jgi:riboflavin synthase
VFTGIVVELGTVREPAPDLVLEAPHVAADAQVGDSVSIEGCCLTVTVAEPPLLRFHAVPETLRRSTLGALAAGDRVNLEPALRVGDRLGGHWVQGHVDGVGALESATAEGEAVNLRFSAPAEVLRYTIEKGSICVAGVSLTVVDTDDDGFSVTVIPHTQEVTSLGSLEPGSPVNLEADVFAKYVEKLGFRGASGTIEEVPR